MNKFRMVALSMLVLFTSVINAETPKTISIKKETNDYIVDIKYPQGFLTPSIDLAIKQLIDTLQSKAPNPADSADLPANVPGKNSLYIDYKIMYQTSHAVSVLFNISSYSRGAAHPNNSVNTLNFIEGKPVELAQLFTADTAFLPALASYCRTILLKKNNSDEKWVSEGSKPSSDNYRYWNFNEKGLSIIFDTYQVAAYVYGPQTVVVPHSVLKPMIKPEVAKMVWGTA